MFKTAALFYLIIFLKFTLGFSQIDYEEIFDIKPNPLSGPDKYEYFIKKKFYTEENIEAGKVFFEMNCAVCHGNEADGTGTRAGTMKEAKPRMLTNLDWVLTRDDLRLLRSIKYGVPGTAMTPWGDLTSSLQRLQLVIFIRSLTQPRLLQEKLNSELYQSFEKNMLAIEQERIREYSKVTELQKKYQTLKAQREALVNAETENHEIQAAKIYQDEIKTRGELKKEEQADAMLVDLKNLIANERSQYSEIGKSLLKLSGEADFKKFLQVVEFNDERFKISEGKLAANFSQENEEKIEKIREEILQNIEEQIRDAERQKTLLQGKIASPERNAQLANVFAKLDSLNKIKITIIAGFENAARLRKKQQEVFQQYNRTNKRANR